MNLEYHEIHSCNIDRALRLVLWSTNVRRESRDEKVSLLWSLQIFHFNHGNSRKLKSINFRRKCNLWQVRILGKIFNPLHTTSAISVVNKVLRRLKPSKFAPSKDAHCFQVTLFCLWWSFLTEKNLCIVNFVARLPSSFFAISSPSGQI